MNEATQEPSAEEPVAEQAQVEADTEYDTWLDTEAAKKLNGQFTNRIFVQHLGDGLIRLNFGDVLDVEEPSYHTAIVLTANNAVQFAELIYRMGNAAMPPPIVTVTATPSASEDHGGS